MERDLMIAVFGMTLVGLFVLKWNFKNVIGGVALGAILIKLVG